MLNALKSSNIDCISVNYINAHATSTISGDMAEIKAIKRLFVNNLKEVHISSYKGNLGHLLGAAGMLFAIINLVKISLYEN